MSMGWGAAEIAQQLYTLAVIAEGLSSVPAPTLSTSQLPVILVPMDPMPSLNRSRSADSSSRELTVLF